MKHIILLSVLFYLPFPLFAGEFSTQIKSASLDKYNEWYQLNADIQYTLSPLATKAIKSSIPLFWDLEITIKKNQPLLNKLIFNQHYRYKIRYHALLNIYSITNENTKKNLHFNTLDDALDSLSKIRNLDIIKSTKLKKETLYNLAIKMQFIREALPVPVRPMAYFYLDWDLSSNWYLWTLKP